MRGQPPASRDELAGLILRYREEQAAQRSRRRHVEAKPRFSAEQRLLILDSWLRSKVLVLVADLNNDGYKELYVAGASGLWRFVQPGETP